MPYITIPGLPFLRDITDWYHSTSSITNHNKGLTNKGSHDPVLIQIKEWKINVVGAPSSGSHAMMTMGDDPSCRNLPGVHPPGTPLHSLAMGIARDKAMSTL